MLWCVNKDDKTKSGLSSGPRWRLLSLTTTTRCPSLDISSRTNCIDLENGASTHARSTPRALSANIRGIGTRPPTTAASPHPWDGMNIEVLWPKTCGRVTVGCHAGRRLRGRMSVTRMPLTRQVKSVVVIICTMYAAPHVLWGLSVPRTFYSIKRLMNRLSLISALQASIVP